MLGKNTIFHVLTYSILRILIYGKHPEMWPNSKISCLLAGVRFGVFLVAKVWLESNSDTCKEITGKKNREERWIL